MTIGDTRIPVTLLTGFLGAGKTTLLNGLMQSPRLSRSLVIINEFGSIGLDHDLVAHSNDEDTIVEMASGCLCCTIKSDLQETLRNAPGRFARNGKRWFERVIIETTGLADPAPIIHTIMADRSLVQQYRLAEIITLVDGVNGAATLDMQPEAVKQVAVADTLIVSKTDLADPAALEQLLARLYRLNPAAPPHLHSPSSQDPVRFLDSAGFDPELKTEDVRQWLNAEAYRAHERTLSHGHDHAHDDNQSNDHHHHRHDINRHDDRIRSICLTIDEPLPAEVFDQWFDLLTTLNGVNMLRVKGIINMRELDRPLVIHGVQHIWHPPEVLREWPTEDRRSRIVFILRDMGESDLLAPLAFIRERFDSVSFEGLAKEERRALVSSG